MCALFVLIDPHVDLTAIEHYPHKGTPFERVLFLVCHARLQASTDIPDIFPNGSLDTLVGYGAGLVMFKLFSTRLADVDVASPQYFTGLIKEESAVKITHMA
tara:strand:- start:145 stop:450 length:306 start_codon:yes stop_codon:yes gene_type:complete